MTINPAGPTQRDYYAHRRLNDPTAKGDAMPPTFSEQPILNSPYEYPAKHWILGKDGVPTDEIVPQRRVAEPIVPVPPPRRSNQQSNMQLGETIPSDEGQEYDLSPIINEIRRRVDAWRQIPNPSSWGASPETARLLQHWRSHNFSSYRPFFCQVEAAETVIWLTEVAGLTSTAARRGRDYETIRSHIAGANAQANPELFRLALKLATGAGKTTVMAMLIAWQTVNAVRHPQRRQFTKNFLIVTPGITIRDRLRSLLPNDAENYYEHRELVPKDMLSTVKQAQVVITNYHAFQRRERETVSRNTRRLVQGRGGPQLDTMETEGQMLRRVIPELMGKTSRRQTT